MSDRTAFRVPEIEDQDIRWACRLLNLPEHAFHGNDGDDPRQLVLKSMERIDVAACPGSGKTTLLVAKLAILAEKWNNRTQGMCVLSHTNVARSEIETRLGNASVGRRLLSYPHFIGTIHGFVNEFLAIPWLRSLGYPIKMIDSDVCLVQRWNALSPAIRSSLERNRHGNSVLSVKSPDFGVGTVRWGRGNLGESTPTYAAIRDVCRQSAQEGRFCHAEMFVWAGDLMDKVPVLEAIRARFPLVFIDEAQDNSEEQSALLHRIFIADGPSVIRQRFGDPNQAIFNFLGGRGATTDAFPESAFRKDIPNSHRFGQEIADLADPLGLTPYGLQGQGPRKVLESGEGRAPHTIFVFNTQNAGCVIEAYGRLLLDTFSDSELRNGVFTAVGQVHRPPENEDPEKFPQHIGHYWTDYEAELTGRDPKPHTLVQFLRAGSAKAQLTGEAFPCVEMLAEGILHLAGMARGAATLQRRRYRHRYILELLRDSCHLRDVYNGLLLAFAVEKEELTEESWEGHWRNDVLQIARAIAGVSLDGNEVQAFLAFDAEQYPSTASTHARCGNTYSVKRGEREVAIRVGSIHSVKGETHTATLILETFWYDHNLQSIKDWLCDPQNASRSPCARVQDRLKLHYVAMTRPTHLLCLAMHERSLSDSSGDVDSDHVRALKGRGWRIEHVDQ